MPDLTMCRGLDCPHKESCYRFTAKPDRYRQSYFFAPPIKDGECEYYWGKKEIKNESDNNIQPK
jgi:hypothetical protein